MVNVLLELIALGTLGVYEFSKVGPALLGVAAYQCARSEWRSLDEVERILVPLPSLSEYVGRFCNVVSLHPIDSESETSSFCEGVLEDIRCYKEGRLLEEKID